MENNNSKKTPEILTESAPETAGEIAGTTEGGAFAFKQRLAAIPSRIASIPKRLVNSRRLTQNQAVTGVIHNAPKELGWPATLGLSVCHMLVMLASAAVVPLLSGFDFGVALFCSGACTLLFQFFTGFRLPIFLSSSFTFVAAYAVVTADGENMVPYLTGGFLVSGGVIILLSILSWAVGSKRMYKLFPREVAVPITLLIGISLVPYAVDRMANAEWWLGAAVVAVGLLCMLYGRGFWRYGALAVALLAGIALAAVTGKLQPEQTSTVISIPNFFMPKFEPTAIANCVVVAVAVVFSYMGDLVAAGEIADEQFLYVPGFSKTMLGSGVALALCGAVGAPAQVTSSYNASLIAISGVYDPLLTVIAAALCMLASFFPGAVSVVTAIPTAVAGGAALLLCGSLIVSALKKAARDSEMFTSTRNIALIAAILILGLAFTQHPLEIMLPNVKAPLTLGGITMATLGGIVLNLILPSDKKVVKG